MIKIPRFVAILCLFFLLIHPARSQPAENIILETEKLSITFTNGAITGLVNRLTGERYVDSVAVDEGVGLLHIDDQSLLADTADSIRVLQHGDTTQILFLSVKGDSFSTFVYPDLQTGDILIWQEGRLRGRKGVYGARMGFSAFNLDAGKIVVPASGGIAIDASSGVTEWSWEYLTSWQAQMLVFEGNTGSVGIWFEDSLFAAKKLAVKRNGSRLHVFLEVHNPGNFARRNSIRTPVLRIKAYTSDWRRPAEEYRALMERYFQPLKLSEKPAWIDSLGLMVIYRTLDIPLLDSLARLVNPRQVMLYVPNWRLAGYDVNYPNYTPRPETAAYIERAHRLGFRVMLHVNPFGIAPYNPLYEDFKQYQLRNPFTGELSGWRWNTDQNVRHAFIHPASTELQDMFLQRMQEVVSTLNPDAIHLDVDFCAWNSDNAILNGENPAQGNRTFHRRLAEAFPQIVWGGENLTEVNFYRDSFAQRWKTNVLSWTPHPILTFLFTLYTKSVGYLGFENPDQDPDLYVDFMNCYERWGLLPTLGITSAKELNGRLTNDVLRIARAWARLGLQPDFDSDWSDDVLFRFVGRNGERAEYRKTFFGTVFTVQGDSLYNKINGVNRFATTHSILGWYAYNESEIFGLDPDEIYWLDARPVDLLFPHLHELSDNVIVNHVSISEIGGHFSLSSLSANNEIDLVDRLPEAELAIRRNGQTAPIGDGAFARKAFITLSGSTKKGIQTHPPYMNAPGEVLMTFSLALPDSPGILLSFYAGLDEGAVESDGVDFFVEINDRQIFKTLVKEKAWQHFTVNLDAWRGQNIRLTLGNDPGPPGHTTYWDWARWGEVVVQIGMNRPYTARLFIPFAADMSGGTVQDLGNHLFEVKGTLPAELTFAAKGEAVLLPFNLLTNSNIRIGTSHNGPFFRDNRPWGAGDIRNVSCGGVSKMAINGHPPAKGSTVIQQIVTLPQTVPLKLAGSYGIADGANTSGVYFSIRIAGKLALSEFTSEIKWFDFEIDLSEFAGKSVLLELITSPGENNYWDWANWADLVISQASVAFDEKDARPGKYALSQPYPNPFNHAVSLALDIASTGRGQYAIYDVLGRRILAQNISFSESGRHILRWDGTDRNGRTVSSGIYFWQVRFEGRQWKRKTLLLR